MVIVEFPVAGLSEILTTIILLYTHRHRYLTNDILYYGKKSRLNNKRRQTIEISYHPSAGCRATVSILNCRAVKCLSVSSKVVRLFQFDSLLCELCDAQCILRLTQTARLLECGKYYDIVEHSGPALAMRGPPLGARDLGTL